MCEPCHTAEDEGRGVGECVGGEFVEGIGSEESIGIQVHAYAESCRDGLIGGWVVVCGASRSGDIALQRAKRKGKSEEPGG